jgi:hypothetical protein
LLDAYVVFIEARCGSQAGSKLLPVVTVGRCGSLLERTIQFCALTKWNFVAMADCGHIWFVDPLTSQLFGFCCNVLACVGVELTSMFTSGGGGCSSSSTHIIGGWRLHNDAAADI